MFLLFKVLEKYCIEKYNKIMAKKFQNLKETSVNENFPNPNIYGIIEEYVQPLP